MLCVCYTQFLKSECDPWLHRSMCNTCGSIHRLVSCYKLFRPKQFTPLHEQRWGPTDDHDMSSIAIWVLAGGIQVAGVEPSIAQVAVHDAKSHCWLLSGLVLAGVGGHGVVVSLVTDERQHHLVSYNNNNNRIQRHNSRFFTISSQRREPSPTRMLKWPRRNQVQNQVQHIERLSRATCCVWPE